MNITQRAHQAIADRCPSISLAIDATLGNGFDGLFLARHLHAAGFLYGFDIQTAAIANSKNLFQKEMLSTDRVHFHLASHTQMKQRIPENQLGKIDVIVFNLGYLPGGNKNVFTKANSTQNALTQAMEILKPGGLCSVMSYPGHPQGAEEENMIRDLVEKNSWSILDSFFHPAGRAASPVWRLIEA